MKRNHEIAVISHGAFARTIRIYSPRSADRAVILHDGNIFFDGADNIVTKLKSLKIKNTAVIGIDAAPSRLDDYLPFKTEKLDMPGGDFPNCGGYADVYRDYILSTLIPYLDKRFAYKQYAMLGISAGAIATLFTAANNTDGFCAYGIVSPPLFTAQTAYNDFLNKSRFSAARYYIHTAALAPEEFLRQIPKRLYDACGLSIVAALGASGVDSVILDTNKTDPAGNPTEPVANFFRAVAAMS